MDTVTPDELHEFKSEINDKLDKILLAMYGNGKPGITTRLALLEQWQTTIDARMAQSARQSEGWKEWIKPTVQSLITAGVIGLIYLFSTHFPNGLP